mgnify:CR=1 FL=1
MAQGLQQPRQEDSDGPGHASPIFQKERQLIQLHREGSQHRVTVQVPNLIFFLENPVDNLQFQEYMSALPAPVEVHCCAYGHPYMKPTHLWHSHSR